jgi:hypothetical protein
LIVGLVTIGGCAAPTEVGEGDGVGSENAYTATPEVMTGRYRAVITSDANNGRIDERISLTIFRAGGKNGFLTRTSKKGAAPSYVLGHLFMRNVPIDEPDSVKYGDGAIARREAEGKKLVTLSDGSQVEKRLLWDAYRYTNMIDLAIPTADGSTAVQTFLVRGVNAVGTKDNDPFPKTYGQTAECIGAGAEGVTAAQKKQCGSLLAVGPIVPPDASGRCPAGQFLMYNHGGFCLPVPKANEIYENAAAHSGVKSSWYADATKWQRYFVFALEGEALFAGARGAQERAVTECLGYSYYNQKHNDAVQKLPLVPDIEGQLPEVWQPSTDTWAVPPAGASREALVWGLAEDLPKVTLATNLYGDPVGGKRSLSATGKEVIKAFMPLKFEPTRVLDHDVCGLVPAGM